MFKPLNEMSEKHHHFEAQTSKTRNPENKYSTCCAASVAKKKGFGPKVSKDHRISLFRCSSMAWNHFIYPWIFNLWTFDLFFGPQIFRVKVTNLGDDAFRMDPRRGDWAFECKKDAPRFWAQRLLWGASIAKQIRWHAGVWNIFRLGYAPLLKRVCFFLFWGGRRGVPAWVSVGICVSPLLQRVFGLLVAMSLGRSALWRWDWHCQRWWLVALEQLQQQRCD